MTWKELRIQFESMLMAMIPDYELNRKLTTDKLNAILDQLYHMCIDRRISLYDIDDTITEDLRPLVKEIFINLNTITPPSTDPMYLPNGDRFMATNLLQVAIPDSALNEIIGKDIDPQSSMNWEVYQNLGLKLVYHDSADPINYLNQWNCKRISRMNINNFMVQDYNYPYIPHPVYTTSSKLENGWIKYDIYLDPEMINLAKLDSLSRYEIPSQYGVIIRVVTHQKFYGVNADYDDTEVVVSFIDEILNVALQLISTQSNPEQQ